MTRFLNLQNLAAAALITGSTFLGDLTGASACDTPRCYWKTVTVYVDVEQPVVNWVTRYDHCYRPYQVKVVTYETVTVPVEKRVKVCY
jgi:hypothetical protein